MERKRIPIRIRIADLSFKMKFQSGAAMEERREYDSEIKMMSIFREKER